MVEEEIKDYRNFGLIFFLVVGIIIPIVLVFLAFFVLENDITIMFGGAILSVVLFLISLVFYIGTILAFRLAEKNNLK